MSIAGCGIVVTPQGPEQVSLPSGPAASECTATFVSASPGTATTPATSAAIVAAWNDQIDAFGIGYLPSGGSWIRCTRSTCGPGRTQLALADHQATVPNTTVPAYAGDPAVAGSIGVANGIVLAANISSSVYAAPNVNDAIVAVASFDGGATWGANNNQVVIVNQGTTVCDIGTAPMQSGSVDRERIAFDPSLSDSTRSTFWITWAGAGSFCVRRVEAARTPTGTTLTPMDSSFHALDTIGPGVGAVVVRVDAGVGVPFVMYSDRQGNPRPGCTSPMNWYITDVTTAFSVSTPVFSAPSYDSCFGTLLDDTTNGNFDFDITPDGTFWAAVHDTRTSIRVLRSGNGYDWVTDATPANLPGIDVGMPNIAVDLSGNVGTTFYQATSTAGTAFQRRIAIRDAAAGAWALSVAISNPPATPNPLAGSGGQRAWGDYQGMTLVDPADFGGNSFFGVWTEGNPANTQVDVIMGARVAVTP